MDSNLSGDRKISSFFLILLINRRDCWRRMWGEGLSRRLASRSVEKMVLVTGPTAKVNWRSFSDGHLRFNFILPGWSEVDAPLQAPGVPSAMHYSWKQLVLYIIIRIIIGAINSTRSVTIILYNLFFLFPFYFSHLYLIIFSLLAFPPDPSVRQRATTKAITRPLEEHRSRKFLEKSTKFIYLFVYSLFSWISSFFPRSSFVEIPLKESFNNGYCTIRKLSSAQFGRSREEYLWLKLIYM